MYQDQFYNLAVRYWATYSPRPPLFCTEEVGSLRCLEGELMPTVLVRRLGLERRRNV